MSYVNQNEQLELRMCKERLNKQKEKWDRIQAISDAFYNLIYNPFTVGVFLTAFLVASAYKINKIVKMQEERGLARKVQGVAISSTEKNGTYMLR